MGLFGSSPQKKLEKGRELMARRNWYEALRNLDDALASGRLDESSRAEAAEGSRACRRAMIALRLEEAESLNAAGDLEGARDRCRTALDLAGEDVDRAPIEEVLRMVNAPRRPVAPRGQVEDALETDLLPEPDRTVVPRPGPTERAPSAEEEPSDADLLGDDPDTLFEVYLHTLDAGTVALYRTLGSEFRDGYLALAQGYGRRALASFDRIEWESVTDPRPWLERAHALLLADRAEEAMDALDSAIPQVMEAGKEARARAAGSGTSPGRSEAAGAVEADAEDADGGDPEATDAHTDARRRYLRVEALRVLGRYDEALETARSLAESPESAGLPTQSLLAWTMLEAGHAQDAYDLLRARIDRGEERDEFVIPAAAAARALEMPKEEMDLLERIIERRILLSASTETEIDFPVETGRRLLELYVENEREPEAVRGLALHLIDHDPEKADTYRQILLELGQD